MHSQIITHRKLVGCTLPHAGGGPGGHTPPPSVKTKATTPCFLRTGLHSVFLHYSVDATSKTQRGHSVRMLLACCMSSNVINPRLKLAVPS